MISWREGTNEPLSGRLAAMRVRYVGNNAGKATTTAVVAYQVAGRSDLAGQVHLINAARGHTAQ